MAAYPCSIGDHRYSGPQRSVYLTRLNGSRPESKKLRLCPRHFGHEVEQAQEHMSDISGESQMSMVCEVVECERPRSTTLFVKIFDQGEEPREYAADVCPAHEAWLTEALGWDSAISM